jgi:hypothetical protein
MSKARPKSRKARGEKAAVYTQFAQDVDIEKKLVELVLIRDLYVEELSKVVKKCNVRHIPDQVLSQLFTLMTLTREATINYVLHVAVWQKTYTRITRPTMHGVDYLCALVNSVDFANDIFVVKRRFNIQIGKGNVFLMPLNVISNRSPTELVPKYLMRAIEELRRVNTNRVREAMAILEKSLPKKLFELVLPVDHWLQNVWVADVQLGVRPDSGTDALGKPKKAPPPKPMHFARDGIVPAPYVDIPPLSPPNPRSRTTPPAAATPAAAASGGDAAALSPSPGKKKPSPSKIVDHFPPPPSSREQQRRVTTPSDRKSPSRIAAVSSGLQPDAPPSSSPDRFQPVPMQDFSSPIAQRRRGASPSAAIGSEAKKAPPVSIAQQSRGRQAEAPLRRAGESSAGSRSPSPSLQRRSRGRSRDRGWDRLPPVPGALPLHEQDPFTLSRTTVPLKGISTNALRGWYMEQPEGS